MLELKHRYTHTPRHITGGRRGEDVVVVRRNLSERLKYKKDYNYEDV